MFRVVRAFAWAVIPSYYKSFLVSEMFFYFSTLLSKPDDLSERFAVIYGICAVFIPLVLTVLALAAKKAAVWKAFVPLTVPVSYFLYLLAYPLRSSTGFLSATLSLPLGWALLGTIAYLGRK